MKGQSGFTLLETVLALFLFLLIVQTAMAVFWHSFLLSGHVGRDAELQYAVRRVRQHLGTDLAGCSQIQVKDDAGQNASSGAHLYLTMKDQILHYYLYNGQLYRDSNQSSPLPLAEYIQNLNFSMYNPGTVVCAVSAQQGNSRCDFLCNMGYDRYGDEVMQGFEE